VIFKNYLKLIRFDNYVKNILILLPAFFQPQLLVNYYQDLIILFVVFSLVSSVGYVVNDLADKESDMLHPQKKTRPIASGAIQISNAYFILILLIISVIFFSYFLGFDKVNIIYLYLALNLIYTFFLKNIAIFDVCILSIFYTLRIVLGAIIINTELSVWLISFSYLFFLNLSSIKRLLDINQNNTYNENNKTVYKNYSNSNLKLLKILIPIFFICSLAVLLVYIVSYNQIFENKLYGLIFLLIIFFWNLRIIKKAYNNDISCDPISYILKDKFTYFYCSIGIILISFFYIF